jgi:hypothetical protein
MKAQMRDNLVERYRKILPGELEAAENGEEVISFLESIERKIIELVFTAGDAFEKEDNNIWLPDELWDES